MENTATAYAAYKTENPTENAGWRAVSQENRDQQIERADSFRDGIAFPEDRVDTYIDRLRRKGLARETVNAYRSRLLWFMQSLPEDRWIDRDAVAKMQDGMLADGLSTGTVNGFTTVINGFLDFCGHRELQADRVPETERKEQPELSRSEYRQLLSAARLAGKERTYLLIKLLANTGLMLEELPGVTVEAVREGILIAAGKPVPISGYLAEELLDYAGRKNIAAGMIFVTRTGRRLDRSNLNHDIRLMAGAAGISPEKGTPRCLRHLYQRTRAKIQDDVEILVEREFARIMEEEQKVIGWDA